MKRLLAIVCCCMLPWLAKAQSEAEVRQAMDRYDYDASISLIAPTLGDSVFTPLRAQALKAMGRPAEALKEWNSLLKADSADIKVLTELAECYRLINRPKDASVCYGKAVELQPVAESVSLSSQAWEASRAASHASMASNVRMYC